MDLQELVLRLLKPKTKAYGFSKKELESVAASIADNLKVEENASEDEINAAAESAVEAVIPFLQVSQSAASRAIQAFKDSTSKKDEEYEDEEDDPKKTKKKDKGGDTPEWASAMMDTIKSLSAEVATLKSQKTEDGRRARLEKLLKDTGVFGERTLKSFSRMSFDKEEDFDEYFEDVKKDLDALNQERANAGLAKLGAPQAQVKKEETETQPLSDDELKSLVDSFH